VARETRPTALQEQREQQSWPEGRGQVARSKERPPSSALAGLGQPLLRCLNSGIHANAPAACRPRLTASPQGGGDQDQRQQL